MRNIAGFFPFWKILQTVRKKVVAWSVDMIDISRECNEPVDWLARKGISSLSTTVCSLDAPPMELDQDPHPEGLPCLPLVLLCL